MNMLFHYTKNKKRRQNKKPPVRPLAEAIFVNYQASVGSKRQPSFPSSFLLCENLISEDEEENVVLFALY
jgi:hypothetical protein